MKIDITYRTLERGRLRRLRVRYRREDGTSAVVVYDGPDQLMKLAEKGGVHDAAMEDIQTDLNICAQLTQPTHYRHGLELSAEELQTLGVSVWSQPREFDLSYENHENNRTLLVAKEWNNPVGQMSLETGEFIPRVEFFSRIARIGFAPTEVRDRNLSGSVSKKRITEDEVEELFRTTKSEDVHEPEARGISFDL